MSEKTTAAASLNPVGGERIPIPKRMWLLFKNNILIICLLLVIILGVLVAILMRRRPNPYSKREVMYARFLGTILVRTLQCVTIPLFMTSIMAALGRLDMTTSSKIAVKTIVYFLTTSLISSILGVILVVVIQPGSGGESDTEGMNVRKTTIVDSLLDIIRNMFPSNIIESFMYTHTTVLLEPENDTTISEYDWDFKVNELSENSNYLGLLVVATALGFAMGYLGSAVQVFTEFIETVNDIFINVTLLIIAISPPGVFCLILSQMLEIVDFGQTLRQIGLYIACCIIGLFIIYLIILPTIYAIFTRKMPLMFMYNALPVVFMAFATASSLATMPTTLHFVEVRNHVNLHISRFVVPLGATVNMNGAAIYNTIGPIFLAQLSNIELSFGHYVVVCITASLASVGVAAIPQGGVITMVMVMGVMSVDPKMIAIIFTADWLLDRVCTFVNVMGDIVAATVVEVLSRKDLEMIEEMGY